MTEQPPESSSIFYNILLAEDSADLRQILIFALNSAGHKVTEAVDGEVACKILDEKSFDLVISDVNMPGANGIDVIKKAKKNFPKIKSILMTGYGDLLEKIDAASLGCSTFLLKPFDSDALLNAVNEAMTRVSWADFDPNSFASVPIDEFNDLPVIRYPIFVQLLDNRFLRVANRGDNVTPERFALLKTKNIFKIWLKTEDFEVYRNRNIQSVRTMVEKKHSVNLAKDSRLISRATVIAFEKMRLMGFSVENIDQSVSIIKDSVQLLLNAHGEDEITNKLEHLDNSFYSQSITCATLVAHMTRIMNWKSSKTISAITLGALLHDIGLADAPKNIVAAANISMDVSEEDRMLFKQHPQKGYELLSKIQTMPDEVNKIVLQHHEKISGNGYPMGYSKTNILPMARIVGIVADYLFFASKEKEVHPTESFISIFQRFLKTYPVEYDVKDSKLLQIALEEDDLKMAKVRYQSDSKN